MALSLFPDSFFCFQAATIGVVDLESHCSILIWCLS
jgi:hypothetical protein